MKEPNKKSVGVKSSKNNNKTLTKNKNTNKIGGNNNNCSKTNKGNNKDKVNSSKFQKKSLTSNNLRSNPMTFGSKNPFSKKNDLYNNHKKKEDISKLKKAPINGYTVSVNSTIKSQANTFDKSTNDCTKKIKSNLNLEQKQLIADLQSLGGGKFKEIKEADLIDKFSKELGNTFNDINEEYQDIEHKEIIAENNLDPMHSSHDLSIFRQKFCNKEDKSGDANYSHTGNNAIHQPNEMHVVNDIFDKETIDVKVVPPPIKAGPLNNIFPQNTDYDDSEKENLSEEAEQKIFIPCSKVPVRGRDRGVIDRNTVDVGKILIKEENKENIDNNEKIEENNEDNEKEIKDNIVVEEKIEKKEEVKIKKEILNKKETKNNKTKTSNPKDKKDKLFKNKLNDAKNKKNKKK